MKLSEYLEPRGRTADLARRIGVHQQLFARWASGEREVPVIHCPAIERATNGVVMRWDLRPDDWYRIWPELINTEGAPQVPAQAEEGAGNA